MGKTVLAFGTFDLLHQGHVKYFAAASKLGSRLIVVIARDDSVKLFKNKAPLMKAKDRALLVGSLKVVDLAVVGGQLRKPSDTYNIFLKYRPDVIALGFDQNANIKEMKQWLTKHGMKTKIVRIKAKLNEKWYKSSLIKRRLARSLS